MVNQAANSPSVRGYTLGEVVLAMALLLIFLVFLIGLFLQLFQSSTKGLDASIALNLAESALSQVNDANPASWSSLMGKQGVINLHVVAGTSHKHDAQKPRKFDLNTIK